MLNEPNTGDLIYLITIKKWHDAASMAGGIDQTFDTPLDAWASIEPVGNSIFFGTKQINESVTDRMMMHCTDLINDRTITAEHVVEHENSRYRVRRATNLNGRKIFLMLEVEHLGDIA